MTNRSRILPSSFFCLLSSVFFLLSSVFFSGIFLDLLDSNK